MMVGEIYKSGEAQTLAGYNHREGLVGVAGNVLVAVLL
jgi:formylmethanofuran dehydrogenase subunit C